MDPLNAPQSLSVKRAEVEFHKFASLGEPERVLAVYAEENERRGALIRKHLDFIGELSPFLEIGANAGHTSYLLANEFGASGFALDISADALRNGIALQDTWDYPLAPVRIAGDAARLPFRDGSLKCVFAYQMLSQFMDIESIVVEVKRVLAPGGIFLFSDEPLKRLLSLRLYRCPYPEQMKAWERALFRWGVLGYLVRDVIGAGQEESFGIRQNHTMRLDDWHRLVTKHFAAHEYDMFVPERGWAEAVVKRAAIRLDPYRSVWRAAKLLGGTLSAVCRKEGAPPAPAQRERFEALLRCPDCGGSIERDAADTLRCTECGYESPNEGGVYNLLRSADRRELYPGRREDIIDFAQPGHEAALGEGWHELEGVFGNKYRWMAARGVARLVRVLPGPQRLRLRGFVPRQALEQAPAGIAVAVNGTPLAEKRLDRPGLFVLEAGLPDAAEYSIEISARPVWRAPGDGRDLTINVSMIRLAPKE